jgi:hypothetical protein
MTEFVVLTNLVRYVSRIEVVVVIVVAVFYYYCCYCFCYCCCVNSYCYFLCYVICTFKYLKILVFSYKYSSLNYNNPNALLLEK